jgi:hypothetical protein
MRFVMVRTALLAAAAAGCSGASPAQTRAYQQETANHIQCVPEQIRIEQAQETEWTAICRGQTYYCKRTERAAGEPVAPGDESTEVSCAALK